MNEWLHEGEQCLIPLNIRYQLEELIRMNKQIFFRNTEAPIAGSLIPNYDGTLSDEVYEWVMRCSAPYGNGMEMELFETDDEAEYHRFADQVERFLRYLKTEVYRGYQP